MITSRRNFLKWGAAAVAIAAVGVKAVVDYATCDTCGGPLGAKVLAVCVLRRGEAVCAKCSGASGPILIGWHLDSRPLGLNEAIVTVDPCTEVTITGVACK